MLSAEKSVRGEVDPALQQQHIQQFQNQQAEPQGNSEQKQNSEYFAQQQLLITHY
jgi:hypothetical protein